MREAISTIRWRLVMSLVALASSILLTMPLAVSRDNLAGKVADVWPNLWGIVDGIADGTAPIGEIWPNGIAWNDVLDWSVLDGDRT